MGKIIVLDWGIFLHRSVFASWDNPKAKPTYTCMSMVLGNLKRIGVEEDDIIILACDFMKSWRKDYEKEYKGDRAKKRAESPIDWKNQYQQFNALLDKIDMSTPWHIIQVEHTEADDVMAVACRVFSDKEVILVTYDHDLEQCWHYDHVRIFSPMSKKWKVKPPKFNAFKLISKMIEKEACDNLTSPILTEEDYFTRKTCVSLLELPEWVENQIGSKLKALPDKIFYPDLFPYDSLKPRYKTLYSDKTKLVDYDKQIEKANKKKLKAKLEKTKKAVKEKTK